MLTNLTKQEKEQILTDGFQQCMINHLCGNYIRIGEHDYEWTVQLDKLRFIAFTDYGTYSYDYDFDYSFDSNLQEFVEQLEDFICKEESDV